MISAGVCFKHITRACRRSSMVTVWFKYLKVPCVSLHRGVDLWSKCSVVSDRTWWRWSQDFVPEAQKVSWRTGTLVTLSVLLTLLHYAHCLGQAGRNATGSCGRVSAQRTKTQAKLMRCSFAWMSHRKYCWRRESKRRKIWGAVGCCEFKPSTCLCPPTQRQTCTE